MDSASGDQEREFLSLVLSRLGNDFVSGFKLSTGLSMETLWNIFRPIPMPTREVLDRSLELDRLGTRFDNLRWKAKASISDLSKAMTTLEKASGISRDELVNADELIKALATEIESLEARIGLEEKELKPYFASEFEVLRQTFMLRALAAGNNFQEPNQDLMVLSNVPTRAGMLLATSQKQAALLQSVDYLVYQGQYSWDGKLGTSLWNRLASSGSVPLSSLALFEAELPTIGRELTVLTADVTVDPIARLNKLLWQLILSVFRAHGEELKDIASKSFQQILTSGADAAGVPINSAFTDLLESIELDHLKQITTLHLIPAMEALASAHHNPDRLAYFSAIAWIHFSVGTVKLYVPDRVFDPQSRPRMEREYFEELHELLGNKIIGLQAFEKLFTGRNTNERIQLLEEEISDLGPLPEEVSPIYRPEQSELGRLHAEFSNVLKAATGPGVQSALQSLKSNPLQAIEELKLVKENVLRLLDRLSARFEAYQDMTRPTINLLRCLLIGVSLCDANMAADLGSSSMALVQVTPFLGGSLWEPTKANLPSKGFEALDLMNLIVAIDGVDNIQVRARELISETFHSFYDEWNKRLEADRKEAAERGSLYRFRGSLEDEEEVDAEEFNELFPTYDNTEEGQTAPSQKLDQVRDQSLRVAEIHRKIFLNRQEPVEAIKSLHRAVGKRIVSELEGKDNIDREITGQMLPATMLLLDETLDSLNRTSTTASYNFYTDANVPEARQLVALAHKIKARFRELQLVDEIGHMQPLADVILSCDKLLELVHTEPLAKILPKVEQLHGHVYEWQFGGWASRVYAVLALHTALTDTVIRWRRLELSTWANLFDMEQKKCHDDAYSWWFIAYQVVIAAPLSMVDSPSELRTYTVSLIENLELYFSTSIVGQYKARLALLRQLKGHLQLLVHDYPNLEIIEHAVANFIRYYARYERLADEAIQKGRQPIEKKMKDVLLMASWKDTNINALRESARKSHQKLFRIVRKFRAVLGQQAKQIITQGLPDEQLSQAIQSNKQHAAVQVPDQAFELLQKSIPGWDQSHRRLANVSKTVSVIRKISDAPEMTTTVPQSVNAFVSELNESMAELKKETPPHLTDENKEQIKHLKTRKRKLFADTLRDLRQMGLKYNLGQDKLIQQESLAKVLALVEPIELPDKSVDNIEYYFHKTLDLAPKVRLASREHSEDLTSAEVARGVGHVEGFISLLVNQRQTISSVAKSLASLKKSASTFRGLGQSDANGPLVRKEQVSNWTRVLPWLLQVLKFADQLIHVHAKLGDDKHDTLTEQFKLWLGRFESIESISVSLSTLPDGVDSEKAQQTEREFSNELDNFREFIDQMIVEKPSIAFILRQVRSWTELDRSMVTFDGSSIELTSFTNNVSTLCDKILVAIEGARKTSKDITFKEEEPSWLTKHGDGFISMVKKLYMPDVNKSVDHCIDMLRKTLEQSQHGHIAVSLISVAAPILDEFLKICEHLVSQVAAIHYSVAHMAYNLTKAFTQIATQGFCTPQEKSDETSNESGKLESGTGLGDGEGAEDISKDIQPDEDLTELAQEANKEQSGEMEDEKDAVDMADEELEGDMGSVDGADEDEEGSKNGDEEEEENDMDEEAGDVDDLDPTAVDEKMWDGENEDEAEKDQQGENAKGQKRDDEQMAAEEDSKQKEGAEEPQPEPEKSGEQDAEDAEEAEAEEEDVKAQEEMNKQEQTAQENDTLALPDEMDLDLGEEEESASESDGLDMLSDIEEEKQDAEEQNNDEKEEETNDAAGQPQEQEIGEEDEVSEAEDGTEEKQGDEVQEDVKPEEDEDEEQQQQPEEQPDETPQNTDTANADTENAAPSDVKSSGQEQNAESMDLDDKFQSNAAQQQDGEMGDAGADQDTSAGNKGSMSRSKETFDKAEEEQDSNDSARSDPFKKLGDALERWHRQQEDIKSAEPTDDKQQEPQQDPQADQGRKEFQHLQDDNEAADTQAMGSADNDQVQPIDDSMAIDEEKQDPSSRLLDQDEDEEANMEDDKMDVGESGEVPEPDKQDKDGDDDGKDDPRSGVKTRQGNFDREPSPVDQETQMMENEDDDEQELQEASTQLSSTHLTDGERTLRDFDESMQQWSEFQTKTHALSLALTSQLRLILTPSQSTKLSGSFRTGKRLNIKRIIPYIASSYKRDKIWMRRAIPTKRTYQILLCVDDSKSMGESSSGTLAMESLVMVSRSLTMLEAGQVGVMGFGSDVFDAHALTEPFGSDAGAKVLQNFSFQQDRTDMALLIRRTIDTFRAARQQQSHGSSDLWQLALILSDGLTPSSAHDSIRRLLREAIEERIMVVFIIMDDTGKKKGDSVLELKEAKFVRESNGESRVVIERYLDTFPFQYYLIVHHLEELPSALAALLRTWFAEVSA